MSAESKPSGILASAFNAAVSAQKSAIAANHAADMKDERPIGMFRRTVDFVTDTVGDTLNVATFGATRRIANAFAGEDKLDYAALSERQKALKSDDDPYNDHMTIKDRARLLAGYDAVTEPTEPEAEPEL